MVMDGKDGTDGQSRSNTERGGHISVFIAESQPVDWRRKKETEGPLENVHDCKGGDGRVCKGNGIR